MGHVERAFREYDRRTERLDPSTEAKQRWFDALAVSTYVPHLGSTDGRVLEIGCNRGYLLRALQANGFTRLEGVDLSPVDLEEARKNTGLATLFCEDATAFLERHRAAFDAIIFKAVFEHIPRDKVEPFLWAVAAALAPSGVVLCEVPNMDWYAASHERFMDVTHEVGYTRESLEQIFGLFFDAVAVHRVVDPAHDALAPSGRRAVRKVVFGLARRLLHLMGEDTATYWFDVRSILAVARSPRERSASP